MPATPNKDGQSTVWASDGPTPTAMPPPYSEFSWEEKTPHDTADAEEGPGDSNLDDSGYGDGGASMVSWGSATEQGPYHQVLGYIWSLEPSKVDAALSTMDSEDAVTALTTWASGGAALVMCAARTGEVEVFTAVLKSMESRLSHEQLRDTLTTTAERGQGSLLMAAAEGGNISVFSQTVELLHGEVLRAAAESWHHGHAVIMDAARSGGLDWFKKTVKILDKKLSVKQAESMVKPPAGGGPTPFTEVVKCENRHIAGAWAEVLATTLSPGEMSKACTDTLAACVKGHNMCGISVMLAYGAEVSSKDLIDLAKAKRDSPGQLKDCFLGSVSSVDNPFIPGMTLLVALEDAAKRAPDEEERMLSAVHGKLEDLLLEVLERLPQSIRLFPAGLDGCVVVFEPETVGIRAPDFRGPMKLAFEERQFTETICISPLVFECMSNTFVAGLPDFRDADDLLGLENFGDGSSSDLKRSRRHSLRKEMLATSLLGRLMQGLDLDSSRDVKTSKRFKKWDNILGDTLLPGAQFILVGVVTRPMAYYKVPSVRMALDFVVHLFMLVVFTIVVVEKDDGHTSKSELLLVFHVTAEIVSALRQMRLNFYEHWQNKWNWLEAVSLLLLAGALIRRISDTAGTTGLALFALSAPLVFSRILFYGQILPRQGLVIQMIAIMLGELLHFAVVMGVIMMGFTVAFFALFQEQDYEYGDAWLDVFKAMLGDADVFDERYEDKYEFAGRFLLAVYLLVMAVLLLNLLIAILSTEHAKVDEVQERANKESRVRIFKLYSRVVDKDFLPPPFSLVQLVLTLPLMAVDRLFGLKTERRAARTIGGLVCWLVLGPCSILAVWALWVASAPRTVVRFWRDINFNGKSLRVSLFGSCAVAIFHVLCLPFVLLILLWIKSGVAGFTRLLQDIALSRSRDGSTNDSTTEKHSGNRAHQGRSGKFVSVALMLEQAPRGQSVREIWAFLEKPTTTVGLVQRRDELVKAATVVHLRSTQDHMEAASKEHSEELIARLHSIDFAIKAELRESEERMKQLTVAGLNALEKKIVGVIEENLSKQRRTVER